MWPYFIEVTSFFERSDVANEFSIEPVPLCSDFSMGNVELLESEAYPAVDDTGCRHRPRSNIPGACVWGRPRLRGPQGPPKEKFRSRSFSRPRQAALELLLGYAKVGFGAHHSQSLSSKGPSTSPCSARRSLGMDAWIRCPPDPAVLPACHCNMCWEQMRC